ncbi:MAG: methionyl-tRNA formyltransferase, partial [Desulfobacula sp.]|nr:methionyl-tRNA formyltransferase [Desulfobacula sp.]
MGTPDFSVNALLSLAKDRNFDVSLVVTQPDRPKGRGKKLAPSPVKKAAQKLGLEIFQPEDINSKKSIERLLSLEPDFFVVAAFGQILSQTILNIPKIYPINIHASLLPEYRGSSPIQAAIANMNQKSGVTTMVMAKGLDTGDILLSTSTPISQNDTAQDLHDTLSLLGANLILKTIKGVLDNSIKPIPQDHARASHVKMLKKSDGKIDWNQSGRQICAHINAMTPWPGAFTMLSGKRIKIFKAKPTICEPFHKIDYKTTQDICYEPGIEPGVIYQCDKQGIHVA